MLRRGVRGRHIRGLLFTDIVGSTDHAAALGDRRWRELSGAHNRAVRSQLRRHGGREMDTAGDGFFAAFDDPGAALDCAVAIARAVATLGLAVRAGVHVGEVAPLEGKVGGIAVNTAARLLALARPGDVLVTSTVRELVAGSDHTFEDRGTHELKGIPGDWRVYAVATGAEPAAIAADHAPPAPRSRRTILVVAAAAVILVLGAASALALAARPRFAPRPESLVALSVSNGDVVTGAEVGRGPNGVAADATGAWVASVDAGTVSRVDEEGRTTSFGNAGDHPSEIAAWDGRAWVSDPYEGRLTIVSPDGQSTPLRGVRARQVAAGSAGVWIIDDVRDTVTRLDPVTGRTSATVQLPAGSGPTGVAVGPDAVWVVAGRSQRVFRIDPATSEIADEIALADPPSAVAWIDGAIWVVSTSTDRMVRIGADGSTQRFDVGDTPAAIAGDATGVWVTATLERRVWQLRPDGTVVRQIALDGVPAGIAVARDRVWVALRSS